ARSRRWSSWTTIASRSSRRSRLCIADPCRRDRLPVACPRLAPIPEAITFPLRPEVSRIYGEEPKPPAIAIHRHERHALGHRSYLSDPTGLTVDAAGRVYVADRAWDRAASLHSPNGAILGIWSVGDAGQRLRSPQASRWTPLEGRIHVADRNLAAPW